VTVDLAHVLLTHPVDWEEQLRRCGPQIGNVRIADVSLSQRRRLPLGQGDLDCRAMVNVLNNLGYAKGLYVALPEYADDAVTTARACLGHLRQCLRGGANEPG
jgi:sugar phosphate isomerase/epimerase